MYLLVEVDVGVRRWMFEDGWKTGLSSVECLVADSGKLCRDQSHTAEQRYSYEVQGPRMRSLVQKIIVAPFAAKHYAHTCML